MGSRSRPHVQFLFYGLSVGGFKTKSVESRIGSLTVKALRGLSTYTSVGTRTLDEGIYRSVRCFSFDVTLWAVSRQTGSG